MHSHPFRKSILLLLLAAGLSLPGLNAASYVMLPDPALARQAPLIVLAEVVESRTRLEEQAEGRRRPYTIVTLDVVEPLKGETPLAINVRVPGGVAEGVVWIVPGVPTFTPGARLILFLAPSRFGSSEYTLTEFGLSKFEVVKDETGRKLAVRSLFRSGEQEILSTGTPTVYIQDFARDYESFISALRAAGRGMDLPTVDAIEPVGRVRPVLGGVSASWVNIGGKEPGGRVICGSPCLFRWAWGQGGPNANVRVTGTQTNLTDSSGGLPHVVNTINAWKGVAGTDVRMFGPAATGNLEIKLDLGVQSNGFWSGPMGCQFGVIGAAGPNDTGPTHTFKGQSYLGVTGADVEMRQSNCASGYTVGVFRSGLLHEVGHTLGLDHPDQDRSNFATTTIADWNVAVMRSVLPGTLPTTAQTDDAEALLYYYPGTGTPPPPTPTITTISPISGPLAGGTTVTINGTNFAAGVTVTFGTTAATGVTLTGTTQISAVAPARTTAGKVDVMVRNSSGTTAIAAAAFEYLAATVPTPTISTISPVSGPLAGGTTVQINGTNFAAGATVTFGGNAATGVTLSGTTQISAVTPAGVNAGRVDVVVRNTSGMTATAAAAYEYLAPTVPTPTISTISPTSGPLAGGTTVTINGTNFASGATVTFGASAATGVTFVGSTQISAVAPAGINAGRVDVVVRNPSGMTATAAAAYEYLAPTAPPPTITSVSPISGPLAGGTTVTINGTNFAAGATVTFGASAATGVTVSGTTQISAVSPASNAAGRVNVVVRNPSGLSASAASAFEYLDSSVGITSVSPRSGPENATTSVTITGRGFTTGIEVLFGGVRATSVVVGSLTSLTAVAPARTAGIVDVSVRALDGGTAVLASGFTYKLANPRPGDANGDATVSVADVFSVINNLFAGGPDFVGSGNANGDGSVSVADVFYLINFLFAGGPAPL